MQITDEDVVRTLREVVAERPDHVYERPAHMRHHLAQCLYVHTDEDGSNTRPGCLVAHVLRRLGLPLNDMRRGEGQGADALAGELVNGLSDETLNLLGNVQGYQDCGDPWAVALRKSEEDAEESRC